MLTVGQEIPLVVEKPATGGAMVGRVEGQIVLVTGAIPGERVTARITRLAKNMAFADTVTVDEPSADRRRTEGDPLCGGSLYAHIAYERQLSIKAQVIEDTCARLGHFELPDRVSVRPSPESGYRMRARLHVRGGRTGFFREGTHEICDARSTRQLLPSTVEVLEQLSAALRSLRADAVRELDVTENVAASARAVSLDAVLPVDSRFLKTAGLTNGLTGLCVGAQLVAGDPYVTDTLTLGDKQIDLRRHVVSFFQANRFLLQDLVTSVVAHVEPEAELLDLYAGVGLFAVAAAVARGARVTAVEGDRLAAHDLAANARNSDRRVEPVAEAVEHFLLTTRVRPRTLIADPPRTGMSREALDGAIGLAAARLVYVSCDVATLARDARRLIEAGYAIHNVEAFDLFPNTPHVETVVVFQNSRM
jgi:23S rRNA (uracil1939-C5)-methyltransferase